MKHLKQALLIAGTTLALSASIASAAVTSPQISVKYASGDLNNEMGRAQVYNDLRSAARKLCGADRFGQVSRLAAHQNSLCIKETVTSAVQKIDNDALTAMNES